MDGQSCLVMGVGYCGMLCDRSWDEGARVGSDLPSGLLCLNGQGDFNFLFLWRNE